MTDIADYDSHLRSRARGAYVGLAIGDALGATVEFMTAKEIVAQLGQHRDIIGGGWLRIKAGNVTDDTTMSLALGKAILEQGGVDAESAADAFNCWLRGKPVDVGNTVRRGIVNYRLNGETQAPENFYDAGNGACMRSLPVALATFSQPECVVTAASLAQAHVTHNNNISDAGCECVIAMVQAALEGQNKMALLMAPVQKLIDKYPDYVFAGKRVENPSGYIVETLQAVFQALFNTGDFETCLIDVVNRGGDADTTGAIAGMIAGSLYGIEAIPKRWLKGLKAEIREACEEQADALMALALVQRHRARDERAPYTTVTI